MECPHCTAELPDDDIFCEECGKALEEESPVERCQCGAPVSEADEDGFCGTCGRRVRPRETDHMEVEVSPSLAAVSDKGKRHDRNEDRFALAFSEGKAILAVCDGVSNSRESELASALAAETIAELLKRDVPLEEAMRQAAVAVSTVGCSPAAESRDLALQSLALQTLTQHDAPSTTAVAAVFQAGEIQVAWAGDSRAYWIADDGAESKQLTVDHSWANSVVAAGEMTAEEAANAPRAHAITRWFGADAAEDAGAETAAFRVSGAGWLLLCSDGLWNYAPEIEDVQRLVQHSGSALELARALVDFANAQGGHDNITAAAFRVKAEV